ncbi:hypothetical protein PanWU01x14_016720 [Parasponia andersonii]|uniref:Uncharacterized protein n=1 Tax=Parasponia andersonii TaxID=3476 RepID=A0A2P5DZR7_PARAD|nr:hypothetical protein PanWU01x14_016720 [Parasponia andersonii]
MLFAPMVVRASSHSCGCFVPLLWLCRVVLLLWSCGLCPTSVSHVGVILHGGRMGVSQARGRMRFVLCMTAQRLKTIIFPVAPHSIPLWRSNQHPDTVDVR